VAKPKLKTVKLNTARASTSLDVGRLSSARGVNVSSHQVKTGRKQQTTLRKSSKASKTSLQTEVQGQQGTRREVDPSLLLKIGSSIKTLKPLAEPKKRTGSAMVRESTARASVIKIGSGTISGGGSISSGGLSQNRRNSMNRAVNSKLKLKPQ